MSLSRKDIMAWNIMETQVFIEWRNEWMVLFPKIDES